MTQCCARLPSCGTLWRAELQVCRTATSCPSGSSKVLHLAAPQHTTGSRRRGPEDTIAAAADALKWQDGAADYPTMGRAGADMALGLDGMPYSGAGVGQLGRTAFPFDQTGSAGHTDAYFHRQRGGGYMGAGAAYGGMGYGGPAGVLEYQRGAGFGGGVGGYPPRHAVNGTCTHSHVIVLACCL